MNVRLSRLAALPFLLAPLLPAALVGPVAAQGTTTAANLASGEGGGETSAVTAHVGAGTAAGVTTGSSGPDQGGGVEPGELPPLPDASQCDFIENDPTAHAYCLFVVVGQTPVALTAQPPEGIQDE